jgi:PhnB protein
MTIKAATPYLMIAQGKAEQAIALYQRALGAKTERMQRFGDVDQSCPAARKDLVMHAVLQAGQATLMLSDDPSPEQAAAGGPLSVALDFDDADEARRCFDGLAATGTIFEKLEAAPWGALFGALRDEFGVNWMFHCQLAQG